MNYVQLLSFWDSNLGIYIPNIYPPFMVEQYGITVSGGIYAQVKLFILKKKKRNTVYLKEQLYMYACIQIKYNLKRQSYFYVNWYVSALKLQSMIFTFYLIIWNFHGHLTLEIYSWI